MSDVASPLQIEPRKKARRLALQRYFGKTIHNSLAIAGGLLLTVLVSMCLLAPLIVSASPTELDLANAKLPPSSEHLLGTDALGRDVFARLLYGGRISMLIGVMGALGETIIGVIFGAIAGYFGGKIDTFFVKFQELLMTFPGLILTLIMVAAFGPGVWKLILIFSITGWTTTFRLVRTEFLSIKTETFIEVGRSLGLPVFSLIFRHMLPNVMSPVVVALTINTAGYMIQEAGLSFLGLGVPPTTPTWGNMLNAAQSVEVLQNYWWMWLVPGITICLFVIAINLIGDALRDILDPTTK
ncbi:MAG: ABC transporter permease [Actinomycetaceae bacterium]|nr:ABC transporter permease [Actinomycetaceae bacterium]